MKRKILDGVVIGFLLLASGCGDEAHTKCGAVYFLTPGIGITNVLTLGMSDSEIKRIHPDADIEYFPEIGISWRSVVSRRLPWQSPKNFIGGIPSLGVTFGGDYRQGVEGNISFSVDPETRRNSVRCDIILDTGMGCNDLYTLDRNDIVKWFGMPQDWIEMGGTNQVTSGMLTASGKSYGVRSRADGIESEMFVFWDRGITFAIENGMIHHVFVFIPHGSADSTREHIRNL